MLIITFIYTAQIQLYSFLKDLKIYLTIKNLKIYRKKQKKKRARPTRWLYLWVPWQNPNWNPILRVHLVLNSHKLPFLDFKLSQAETTWPVPIKQYMIDIVHGKYATGQTYNHCHKCWESCFFYLFFPSFPRPWPNIEQKFNVCGWNCSVVPTRQDLTWLPVQTAHILFLQHNWCKCQNPLQNPKMLSPHWLYRNQAKRLERETVNIIHLINFRVQPNCCLISLRLVKQPIALYFSIFKLQVASWQVTFSEIKNM